MTNNGFAPGMWPGGTPICRPMSSACIMTPFLRKSYTQWPCFPLCRPTVQTQWPFFSKFQRYFIFFAHKSARFKNFVNFQLKRTNFHSNLTKFTPNDPLPLFWEVYTKEKAQWPLFSTKSYTEHPRGVLRFGLVGDVPPAVRDTYPCSGVFFYQKSTHLYGFFRKKVPILAIFFFSKFSGVRYKFWKSDHS